MKKNLKTAAIAFLALGMAFTSCKKKDNTTDNSTSTPQNPSATFKSGNSTMYGVAYTTQSSTVDLGTVVVIGVSATPNTSSSSKIKDVKITDAGGTLSDSTSSSGWTSFSYDYMLPTSSTGTMNYTVTVTDAAGESSSLTISITTQNPAPQVIAIGTGSITLGGSVDSNPSYLNLATGTTYGSSTVSSNASSVDLVYNKTKVMSPSDAGVTNTAVHSNGLITKMDVYTAKTYASITSHDIDNYTPTGGINATLANGTIVMFQTNAGKKGVFQVTTFNGSATSSTTDNITIVGQIQQ